MIGSSEHVNYRNQKPSNKVIVLGLAKHLTEADVSKNSTTKLFIVFINEVEAYFKNESLIWLQINADLHICGIQPLSIRLIRKRKTGKYQIQFILLHFLNGAKFVDKLVSMVVFSSAGFLYYLLKLGIVNSELEILW